MSEHRVGRKTTGQVKVQALLSDWIITRAAVANESGAIDEDNILDIPGAMIIITQ